MKVVCRTTALAAALIGVLAFGATANAAANKCSSGKVKLVGKKAAGILGCYSKAAGKGLAADPLCTQKVKDKFVAGSQKIDAKQAVAKPETVCPAGGGDHVAIEAIVDKFTDDVSNSLNPVHPPGAFTLNKCSAGKISCAGKKAAAILGCYSKALGKGVAVDPLCISKAETKFSDCYAKLETKPPCLTNGDAAAIEEEVNELRAIILHKYGPPSCPTLISFTGTSTTGVLDSGWTGQGHDATVISDGTVTVSVTSCANAAPPCGVCSYVGPVVNEHQHYEGGDFQPQRCSNDTSIACTNNTPCTPGGGTCKFYFGTYLPLAAGGVATCVGNEFNGGITGTANVDTGTSAGAANLISRVYSAGDLSHPCSNCDGDVKANDGIAGGTCSSGTRAGLACDANGSSPNVQFGTTSLDCPPLPSALIASLPIDLSNTTGSKTKTLAATNPDCRAAPGKKCQCDTCNSAGVIPCSANADCPDPAGPIGPICGGKRCGSGANVGAACTNNTECPGGACTVPGQATAPNACDDNTCSPDAGTPGPNDRACLGGPFDTLCGPVETFRGCLADSDCPFPGDTCSGGKFRDCFDNGTIGDTVTATGQADPPSGHQSDPTLAALFCIGNTSSSAVNAAAGLPGLGRLELQGHSTDDGTP